MRSRTWAQTLSWFSRHDSSRADVFFLKLSHNVTEATNKLIYEFKEHISAGAMAAV
jgi:hypothetical protein